MARILITGAGGTIGQVLMRDLSHLSPIGVRSREHDLTKIDEFSLMLDRYQPDVLIHCAARGGKSTLGQFVAKDLLDNLAMAENLYQLSHRIRTIINIGSGAEYGIENHLSMVMERNLELNTHGLPSDSYGLSKRLTWQRLSALDNAITLRLFGCFDPTEPDFRLLRRFVNSQRTQERFVLRQDRKFSWISGTDLSLVVSQIIRDSGKKLRWWGSVPKTINISYEETNNMLLSELLDRWCFLNGVKPCYEIDHPEIGQSYTCSSETMLYYLKSPLKGLDACLGDYQ